MSEYKYPLTMQWIGPRAGEDMTTPIIVTFTDHNHGIAISHPTMQYAHKVSVWIEHTSQWWVPYNTTPREPIDLFIKKKGD